MWRLTGLLWRADCCPGTFRWLYSYQVDCGTLTADPITPIQKVAAGQSGPQYNGDGYWQFNWKTPEEYAATCHMMYI